MSDVFDIVGLRKMHREYAEESERISKRILDIVNSEFKDSSFFAVLFALMDAYTILLHASLMRYRERHNVGREELKWIGKVWMLMDCFFHCLCLLKMIEGE